MSDDSVTIGTYLQLLQLKVKLVHACGREEMIPTAYPCGDVLERRSEFIRIHVPPSLRVADICPQLGNFVTDSRGNLYHPDTNFFEYIRITGGEIFTRNLAAFSIQCGVKRHFKVPNTLRKISPHRFLFALQQYFNKEMAISCRVMIEDSALPVLRRAKDAFEMVDMLNGSIPVQLLHPQSALLKLRQFTTLELDTSSYYWSDNVFLLSDDTLDMLRKLIGLYISPQERKALEMALITNYIRTVLCVENIERDLRQISDNEKFLDEFLNKFVRVEPTAPPFNPRIVRAINTVNDKIGDLGLLTLEMVLKLSMLVLVTFKKAYRILAGLVRFLFANELAALFIYLTCTFIMLTSTRRGNTYLYGLLLGIAFFFTAITVLQVRFHVDVTNLIVKRTFPEVYPSDMASAELDKNVQQICVIPDPNLRRVAISQHVDAMRRFPNVLKAINVCVLGTVPSLILAWREETERRRATLTSLIRKAVDQELQRRVTAEPSEVSLS